MISKHDKKSLCACGGGELKTNKFSFPPITNNFYNENRSPNSIKLGKKKAIKNYK